MELAIFQILILIVSVVIHELSHGFAADFLGDSTARDAGRLTLNPLKHLDPFGSVLLPLLTYFGGGFIFGYAKPVPYNPFNLKHPRRDGALIAAAGPLSNFLVALVFGVIYRLVIPLGGVFDALAALCGLVVFTNVLLGVFNLVPIPPLDGSRVLFAVLPEETSAWQYNLERYGMILLIVFLMFGFRFIAPIILAIAKLLLGV